MKTNSVLLLVIAMLFPCYYAISSKIVNNVSFFNLNNVEEVTSNTLESTSSETQPTLIASSLIDALAEKRQPKTPTTSTISTDINILSSNSTPTTPFLSTIPTTTSTNLPIPKKTTSTNSLPSRLSKEIGRLSEKNNLAIRNTLKQQQRFLGRKHKRNSYTVGNKRVTKSKLKETVLQLDQWLQQSKGKSGFDQKFAVHKLKGRGGQVRLTGYYTPIIKARRNKTATYRYPLYKKPKKWRGRLPARRQIDHQNALAGKGLELAWTNSLFDNYSMQLQGSGYIEYQESGERALLAYSGQNGHPYIGVNHYKSRHIPKSSLRTLASIERWMEQHPKVLAPILNRNPSYTFFVKKGKNPRGSMSTDLLGDHSIAVDPRYIPYGSCLLANVPIVNSRGKIIGHELRILLAQDKGGAIKGNAHVDLYCGIGEAAKKKAQVLNHYADVWLLLAK